MFVCLVGFNSLLAGPNGPIVEVIRELDGGGVIIFIIGVTDEAATERASLRTE
jgi:hypothetical protein